MVEKILPQKTTENIYTYFLIGNKTFIEENEHRVHDDEHSGHDKIQKAQELKLTNCRKANIEIHHVKPQIRTY